MPPDPAPTTETTTGTPEPTGTATSGQTPPETPQQPFKVFNTQAEYEAAFGPTRTEGRKSLAKSMGFDTIEAFEQKWNGLTQLEQQQMTEKQRIEAERDQYKTAAQTRFQQASDANMARALDELLAEANIKPDRREAFLRLREAAEGEVDPQTAAVNKDLVKHSILTAAQTYPEFVQTAPTVGVTTGVPANVAGAKVTTEEQTKKHIGEGNMLDAIGSQLGKLFGAAS